MYKVYTSSDKLPELSLELPVFADIETDGLYTNPRLIQLYQPQTQKEVIIIDLDYISIVDAILYIEPLHTVWYNASYDLGTLNTVTAKLDDLFYATKIAYPEFQEFSLDIVVDLMRLGNYYENLDKKAMQKSKFTKGAYLSAKQLEYAATDTIVLEQIYLDAKIQEVIKTNLAYKVDIFALVETMQWQQNGMPVLKEVWEDYMAKAKKEVIEYELLLPEGLNTRSHLQVKKLLGTDSSDKPTLMRLAINEGSELAENILKLRKSLNDISKLESYNFPRVYGKFNPYGTATGRYKCTGGDLPNGINMQNFPRQFKGIFGVAKDSKYTIVSADYSTLEIRIACAVYGDANMYSALKQGIDIHKHTAALIYDKPVSEVEGRERSNAKVCNFGFLFGLSAATFVDYAFDLYALKFTVEQAQELKDKFFSAYPDVKSYHGMCWSKMKKGNYVTQTALGRRISPKLGTDAINAPVQGTGAECGKLAIHYMVRENPDTLKYFMNMIHDSFYLLVPDEEKTYWGDLLQRSMLKAWAEISKSSLFKYRDIPMKADVVYGKTLKDLSSEFEGGGQALSLDEMKAKGVKNAK